MWDHAHVHASAARQWIDWDPYKPTCFRHMNVTGITASAKAQFGRDLIKDAVLQLLREQAEPLTHAEIVRRLGIPSDFQGGNANFLSWSILGLLVNEAAIVYEGDRQQRIYFLPGK